MTRNRIDEIVEAVDAPPVLPPTNEGENLALTSLSKDLRVLLRTERLDRSTASRLVSIYYSIQKVRIGTSNREYASQQNENPHVLISYVRGHLS